MPDEATQSMDTTGRRASKREAAVDEPVQHRNVIRHVKDVIEFVRGDHATFFEEAPHVTLSLRVRAQELEHARISFGDC